MDIHEVEVGIQGPIAPPFDRALRAIKRAEEIGYDSIWWPDHWMGWIPDSIWARELVGEIAERIPSPHMFFECYTIMAAAAVATHRVLLGSSVTEPVRRHPAEIAQAFLTLDHISSGRVILGIGAGELENIEPYGIKWGKPAERLREAIEVIKLLWTGRKVSYNGMYWRLKDAIIALPPAREGRHPPIWVGAHRKRTLQIAGELGDGWIPTHLSPEEYSEKLQIVLSAAKRAGRSPNEITPALFISVVAARDHEECHKLLTSIVGRVYALLLPSERYEKHGYKHPLGKFNALTDFIPTRYPRDKILKLLEAVPQEMCEERSIHGTADDIIAQIESYMKAGMKHIVMWNETPVLDYKKTRESYEVLKKVVEYIKGS